MCHFNHPNRNERSIVERRTCIGDTSDFGNWHQRECWCALSLCYLYDHLLFPCLKNRPKSHTRFNFSKEWSGTKITFRFGVLSARSFFTPWPGHSICWIPFPQRRRSESISEILIFLHFESLVKIIKISLSVRFFRTTKTNLKVLLAKHTHSHIHINMTVSKNLTVRTGYNHLCSWCVFLSPPISCSVN